MATQMDDGLKEKNEIKSSSNSISKMEEEKANMMKQVDGLIGDVLIQQQLQERQIIEDLIIDVNKSKMYNVEQLKMFCKERKIRGYSKLKKNELIEVLYLWQKDKQEQSIIGLERQYEDKDVIDWNKEATPMFKKFKINSQTFYDYFRHYYKCSVFETPSMEFEIQLYRIKEDSDMFKNYYTEIPSDYPYVMFKIKPPKSIYNYTYNKVILMTFRYDSKMAKEFNKIINPNQYGIFICGKYFKENEEHTYIDGGNVYDLNDKCEDADFDYF